MSNSAVINIKIEARFKREVQKAAEDLGLSLSALIKGFLKQFARTKEIHFNAEEEPTEYLLESLRESRKDVKAGRVISFKEPRQAISYLDKLITNDRKRQKS